ncbi:MAG: CBS domain-containing protein, partial [Oscillospiraceae bacterium]|nr:CBS domain-containing protein [Oscillospiraceae bacterium]
AGGEEMVHSDGINFFTILLVILSVTLIQCIFSLAAIVKAAKTPVRDIMSRSVVTASPEDDISRVSELMSRAQVRRLPVVSEGQLVGVIALGDLARRTACDMEASKALTDISANLKRL